MTAQVLGSFDRYSALSLEGSDYGTSAVRRITANPATRSIKTEEVWLEDEFESVFEATPVIPTEPTAETETEHGEIRCSEIRHEVDLQIDDFFAKSTSTIVPANTGAPTERPCPIQANQVYGPASSTLKAMADTAAYQESAAKTPNNGDIFNSVFETNAALKQLERQQPFQISSDQPPRMVKPWPMSNREPSLVAESRSVNSQALEAMRQIVASIDNKNILENENNSQICQNEQLPSGIHDAPEKGQWPNTVCCAENITKAAYISRERLKNFALDRQRNEIHDTIGPEQIGDMRVKRELITQMSRPSGEIAETLLQQYEATIPTTTVQADPKKWASFVRLHDLIDQAISQELHPNMMVAQGNLAIPPISIAPMKMLTSAKTSSVEPCSPSPGPMRRIRRSKRGLRGDNRRHSQTYQYSEDMFLPIERKRLAAKLLNNLGRMSSQIKTQQTAALNRPSSDFNAKPKANKNGGLKLLEGSCDLSWSTIHHSMAPFVSPFMSYPPSPRLFLQFPQPNTMTRPSKIKSTHPCINLC